MIANHLPSSTSTSMLSLLSCATTGQLADFCAQAVPSIWGSRKQQPMKRTIAFKQFCQKIIKATQVSWACIVLGLYYIHRLRSAYPYIHASVGSEIRLFTTALVLANKYLDDNTFTNKTWSEVSSIPMAELNIMEMEFLSALQYNIHLPYDLYFQWIGQCQQWISPTIMNPTLDSISLLKANSSNLKRFYQDTVEDSRQAQRKKRPTTHINYTSSSPVNTKMPYTPPESYLPTPTCHSTTSTSSSCSSYCYPTPPTYTDDGYCRPILSWSSSSSSSPSSSTSLSSVPGYFRQPYHLSNQLYQTYIPSALSGPVSAPLH
ncbi:cyclin-domain-containing protein [Chlamydoabsidia padenii]|nr:cyclin-domain-containing protein [Chlamydoabsidia padenii]